MPIRSRLNLVKPKWLEKLPFLAAETVSIDDLRDGFMGYLGLVKFNPTPLTKPGQRVITPNGIGTIMSIIKKEYGPHVNKNRYSIVLRDKVSADFYAYQLKQVAVYPTDFYDNKVPILLSFHDYFYANPSGITDGIYSFTITTHGYALMTKKTREELEINEILSTFSEGARMIKTMRKHKFHIIKKGDHHVKKEHKRR